MAALSGSVSKRYARAIFGIGADNGKFEAYGEQLESLARMYKSSDELRQVLASPRFKDSEKRAVMQKLLDKVGATPEITRFILLLLDRGRLLFLPNVARDFRRMADDKLGQVRGKITSAEPLDKGAFKRIHEALEKRVGRKVILDSHVDPEILGGVIAQVGDVVMDGSLRTRLHNLSNRLLN